MASLKTNEWKVLITYAIFLFALPIVALTQDVGLMVLGVIFFLAANVQLFSLLHHKFESHRL
jgi:hypothetical protein